MRGNCPACGFPPAHCNWWASHQPQPNEQEQDRIKRLALEGSGGES